MKYHVQITSLWQGDRWRSAYVTDDEDLAERMANALEIEENRNGAGNPGLTRAREARAISEKKLLEVDGPAAVRQGRDDVEMGWADDKVPKRIDRDTGVREPYPEFTWRAVSEEVEIFLDNDGDANEDEGVDFLLRKIPTELHNRIKIEAAESGTTMRALMLEKLGAPSWK